MRNSNVTYVTVESFKLSQCFTGIKSVCVIGSCLLHTTICVRAEGCSLGLVNYGGHGYYYIQCYLSNILWGTVIDPKDYDAVIIDFKAAVDNTSHEELSRFYRVKFTRTIY